MKNLPITQEVKGHVTRAAAYHLYAKACLTFSTYTDGLGNTTALTDSESKTYLEKAKAAADYLIQNAGSLGVKLYDDIEAVLMRTTIKTTKKHFSLSATLPLRLIILVETISTVYGNTPKHTITIPQASIFRA